MPHVYCSRSAEQTFACGAELGRTLRGSEVVLLTGGLGAGKTLFTQGMASALGIDPGEVVSPSYVLMIEHRGRLPLFHFDLYRLGEHPDSLRGILDDWLGRGVVVVEWAEYLPEEIGREPGIVHVQIVHTAENERQITIETAGKKQDSPPTVL